MSMIIFAKVLIDFEVGLCGGLFAGILNVVEMLKKDEMNL